MTQIFKQDLENYLLQILGNVDQNLMQNFQEQYEKLIDEFESYNFLPKKEIDTILNSSLDASDKKIKELKQKIESLNIENSKLIENNKFLDKKNEEIAQKYSILEKSLNKSTNDLKKKKAQEQKMSELQSDYDLLKSKYAAIQDEISMCKKNLKKNYTMEKEISQLTEENEKLSMKIKELSSEVNYKLKFEEISQKYKEVDLENKNLTKLSNKSKQEIESIKHQLEEVNENLNNVENEKRLKNYQLEEKIKENIKIMNEKEEVMKKIKEIEYNLKTNKTMIENQNKQFKKEIDKLRQENNILKKEKEFINKELQKFKTYTNLAKISRENLTKKDFSLLETMSRRVEESESLANNLKIMVQKLDTTNSILKEKNEKYENIILYYMKERGEMKNIDQIDEELKEDKGYQEISEMKYDREVLLSMIFKLKQENIKINQSLQQITVEANTKIRNLTEQVKK